MHRVAHKRLSKLHIPQVSLSAVFIFKSAELGWKDQMAISVLRSLYWQPLQHSYVRMASKRSEPLSIRLTKLSLMIFLLIMPIFEDWIGASGLLSFQFLVHIARECCVLWIHELLCKLWALVGLKWCSCIWNTWSKRLIIGTHHLVSIGDAFAIWGVTTEGLWLLFWSGKKACNGSLLRFHGHIIYPPRWCEIHELAASWHL